MSLDEPYGDCHQSLMSTRAWSANMYPDLPCTVHLLTAIAQVCHKSHFMTMPLLFRHFCLQSCQAQHFTCVSIQQSCVSHPLTSVETYDDKLTSELIDSEH